MPTPLFESHQAPPICRDILSPYLDGIIAHWLLVAPSANPGMLEMFHDRDNPPYRDLVPWAGEFAGKYLTGAVEVLRETADRRLDRHLQQFVRELISCQDDDGYFGPWPREYRLKNVTLDGRQTWDTWGHYHIMLGLIEWYGWTFDEKTLKCLVKIADLLVQTFGSDLRLVDTGSAEMNLAPAHSLAVLYCITGNRAYLELSMRIVDEFGALGADGEPLAGDWLRLALDGKPFYATHKPRWESLHAIMALPELYYATGDEQYRDGFINLWRSILAHDIHNNGGFSSGERATGNPYDPGPIETCCTIAWMAMCVEMLKMTGDAAAADALESATLNSVMAMHSDSGRWVTYNTPMSGVRRASAHSIVFQAREGTPDLNCCSVNSSRGFGLLSKWAYMRSGDGIVVNWLGKGQFHTVVSETAVVRLAIGGDYPTAGEISILVQFPRQSIVAGVELDIKIRIPAWSSATHASLNGETVEVPANRGYLSIKRFWHHGDRIRLSLDMSIRREHGARECSGLSSLYRGPLLLAYDQRYNPRDNEPHVERHVDDWHGTVDGGLPMPSISAVTRWKFATWERSQPPILLMEGNCKDGTPVRVCDYASAGKTGTIYRSWMIVDDEK